MRTSIYHDPLVCGLPALDGPPPCRACHDAADTAPPTPMEAARAQWRRLRADYWSLLRTASHELPEPSSEDAARFVAFAIHPKTRELADELLGGRIEDRIARAVAGLDDRIARAVAAGITAERRRSR